MTQFIVLLEPGKLQNADLDIRYSLPNLIVERAAGALSDNGYDYVANSDGLMMFLEATDVEKGRACILDVVENESVLENELKSCGIVVAVEADGKRTVIYPGDFKGSFPQ